MSHKTVVTVMCLVLTLCQLSTASLRKYNVTLKTTWCQNSCVVNEYETSKCTSSIQIDGKEMSQQKDGFNIVDLRKMKSVALRWFDAAQQGTDYDNFLAFCGGVESGSVLLIALQNMCNNFDPKWYNLLRDRCNVTVPQMPGKHNMALTVACKGHCVDYEPKSQHKYVTELDSLKSITRKYVISAQVEEIPMEEKSYSKVILVAVLVILVAVVLVVLCILWNNRRRRGDSNMIHVKASDKKNIIYKPSAEEKYNDPSTLPPPPANDEEDGAYLTMLGGKPSVKYEVPNARKVPNSPKNNNQGYDYAYSNNKRNNTMSNNSKKSSVDDDPYENMNGDAYVDMTDARSPLNPKSNSSNPERQQSEFDDEPYVNMNIDGGEGEDEPYVDMLPYNKRQSTKKKKKPKSSKHEDIDDDAYENMDGDDDVYESMDLYQGEEVF